MKYIKLVLSGILAGLFIGLGSFAFVGCVALDPTIGKIIGSALFSVGLFCVCFFTTHLYTGRIGFSFEQKPSYVLDLLAMLAGNFIGAAGSGSLVYLACSTESENKLVTVARSIADARAISIDGGAGEAWYKALLMAFFCGILVFLAVYIWKRAENWGIKAAGLILCVWAFVVTGTEHCIANMFYYALAGRWNLGDFLNVIVCIAGNSLGSWCVYWLFRGAFPPAPTTSVSK
jgi:formate/nitrite transporter FocA (FNT family)